MLRQTLIHLAHSLASGETTSRALVEESLARITHPNGEGGRALAAALAGGAAAVGAWLCLGAAAVLAMLYKTV